MEQQMSFSQRLKKELAGASFTCKSCKAAELYGLLLFGRCLDSDKVSFSTEHKSVADRFTADIIDVTSAIVTVKYYGSRYHKNAKLYTVLVEDDAENEMIREKFPPDGDFTQNEALKNNCCASAFLRGAFMACGSVIDPLKEYHLEFCVYNSSLSGKLKDFILSVGIPIKETERKGIKVLYLKESENIEDIITFMGAGVSSLEIMNVKILKDVRNKINRITNCETANIGKTVAASSKQIEDIQYIKAKKGLKYLPEELRETAALRLAHPDLSLKELSQKMSEPISRSGLNHRLKRIEEIANKLRKQE